MNVLSVAHTKSCYTLRKAKKLIFTSNSDLDPNEKTVIRYFDLFLIFFRAVPLLNLFIWVT